VIGVEIIQIVGLGLIATVLSLVIKEQKPLFSFMLAAFTGIVIFLFLIGKISAIIQVLSGLALKSNINMVFLKTILKIIGVAYIAEFGAQIIRDAGQEAIASKVELAGKILIMVMAIPIITVIIETVMKLLPA
jgi:stage III sporulation protein AD